MVNYGRVQFVSIELGISPITLIHNRLHAWECFLVAPRRRNANDLQNRLLAFLLFAFSSDFGYKLTTFRCLFAV